MATASRKFSTHEKDNIYTNTNWKIGIVSSKWNSEITNALTKGAKETLISKGILPKNITHIEVPGSFELVYASKKMMDIPEIKGIIAIGSLIKGETEHFHYICNAVSLGIKDLNLLGKVPISFCILTDNNLEQALARSGGKYGNKGTESALGLLEMCRL